jgi:hypothetical protein
MTGNYDWERYWVPREGSIAFDNPGFLVALRTTENPHYFNTGDVVGFDRIPSICDWRSSASLASGKHRSEPGSFIARGSRCYQRGGAVVYTSSLLRNRAAGSVIPFSQVQSRNPLFWTALCQFCLSERLNELQMLGLSATEIHVAAVSWATTQVPEITAAIQSFLHAGFRSDAQVEFIVMIAR